MTAERIGNKSSVVNTNRGVVKEAASWDFVAPLLDYKYKTKHLSFSHSKWLITLKTPELYSVNPIAVDITYNIEQESCKFYTTNCRMHGQTYLEGQGSQLQFFLDCATHPQGCAHLISWCITMQALLTQHTLLQLQLPYSPSSSSNRPMIFITGLHGQGLRGPLPLPLESWGLRV